MRLVARERRRTSFSGAQNAFLIFFFFEIPSDHARRAKLACCRGCVLGRDETAASQLGRSPRL
jgi:hypothetical protein